MKKSIALLPGDGIGPEVISATVNVLDAVAGKYGHEFVYGEAHIGGIAIDKEGDPFPKATEKLCRESDAILFGAIGDPKYDNNPQSEVRPEQGLLRMRKTLGLFANIRPVISYESLRERSPLKSQLLEGVDFIIVRELTGGIYFGKPSGRSVDGKTAFDTCTYNIEEITRVTQIAFDLARKRKKKVTLVDKANVLSTSRLWREVVTELAKTQPDIELDYMFVDNAAMQIILNPAAFDVILTENMFGDILTDEASVITGSLGMMPSASYGEKYSLFEPIHGSYPQAAGKNIANPIAAILSSAMMLETSFKMQEEANDVRMAVERAIAEGKVTRDLADKSALGTRETAECISEYVKLLQE